MPVKGKKKAAKKSTKKVVAKAAPKKATKRQLVSRKIVREVNAIKTKQLVAHDLSVLGDHKPIMLGDIEWRDDNGGKRSNRSAWLVVTCNNSTTGCDYRAIAEQFSVAKLIADQAS